MDGNVFGNMAAASYGNSLVKEYTSIKNVIQKMRKLCLVVIIMSLVLSVSI
jgi:hypothetical protein